MTQEVSFGKLDVVYNEMNEADREGTIEIALNALKLQEKSEKQLYHKDLAQYIKQELDTLRGYYKYNTLNLFNCDLTSFCLLIEEHIMSSLDIHLGHTCHMKQRCKHKSDIRRHLCLSTAESYP
jgi:hypothetical protein